MLLCLLFMDGAFKGHFGKVCMKGPPVRTVVKLLCLQHVTEIECVDIQECEVSVSVRCNDDSCMQISTQLHMCRITSHFRSSSVADVRRCICSYTITMEGMFADLEPSLVHGFRSNRRCIHTCYTLMQCIPQSSTLKIPLLHPLQVWYILHDSLDNVR